MTNKAIFSPRVLLSVLARPHLWITAVTSAVSLAPKGWWRRSPFLPIPDDDWLRFRLETAYGGDGTGPIDPQDLITWLEWRKSFD